MVRPVLGKGEVRCLRMVGLGCLWGRRGGGLSGCMSGDCKQSPLGGGGMMSKKEGFGCQ